MADGSTTLENAAPTIRARSGARDVLPSDLDDNVVDPIDIREIFDLLRDINDPEVRWCVVVFLFFWDRRGCLPAPKLNEPNPFSLPRSIR